MEGVGKKKSTLSEKPKLAEKDITGLKYFDQISPVLQRRIAALPRIMEASFRKADTGSGMVKWRLHTHFALLRGVPTRIDVTPDGGGPHDERAMLEATLEPDRLYVTDRGYARFLLFNKLVAIGSSYVCGLRDNSVWKTVTANYRNDNAGLDEIISDEIVEFKDVRDRRLDHKVRVICVRINPHTSRSKYAGGSSGVDSDGILRIATNLLEVPADVNEASNGSGFCDMSLLCKTEIPDLFEMLTPLKCPDRCTTRGCAVAGILWSPAGIDSSHTRRRDNSVGHVTTGRIRRLSEIFGSGCGADKSDTHNSSGRHDRG